MGDGSHPFPEEDIREILGRPTLLAGHLARPPVSPGSGARGPTGGHGPTPDLAGHLATQEGAERGGAGVAGAGVTAPWFSELIRGTFLEEVPMGMVEGPFSKEEAASRCGCKSEDLCPGPLAGIDEGDKIRTIYDGSVGGANATIRNQTVERTAPTVLDGVQALHWLHAAAAEGPPLSGCLWPQAGGWLWPEPAPGGADVTKAHRRVKVFRKDWRLGEEWWVNKVGTYGMASAQSYWGRLAALLLRVLYAPFPQVDWNFVFVDDFLWLL